MSEWYALIGTGMVAFLLGFVVRGALLLLKMGDLETECASLRAAVRKQEDRVDALEAGGLEVVHQQLQDAFCEGHMAARDSIEENMEMMDSEDAWKDSPTRSRLR